MDLFFHRHLTSLLCVTDTHILSLQNSSQSISSVLWWHSHICSFPSTAGVTSVFRDLNDECSHLLLHPAATLRVHASQKPFFHHHHHLSLTNSQCPKETLPTKTILSTPSNSTKPTKRNERQQRSQPKRPRKGGSVPGGHLRKMKGFVRLLKSMEANNGRRLRRRWATRMRINATSIGIVFWTLESQRKNGLMLKINSCSTL